MGSLASVIAAILVVGVVPFRADAGVPEGAETGAQAAPRGSNSSSLEKDYADLCANKPAPESETCAALKRALVAKLSGGAADTANPSSTTPTPSVTDPVELRHRWGYLVDSVGKTYFRQFPDVDVSLVEVYDWQLPGEWMVITRYCATKAGEIRNDPGCPPTRFHVRYDPPSASMTAWDESPGFPLNRRPFSVQADGSTIHVTPDGKQRVHAWRNADGSLTEVPEELKPGGVWKRMAFGTSAGTSTSREMTPQFVAQLRGGGGSQDNDDGVFSRALGGALTGALLGGSMDAAVAGAQSAAQGGNSLEVINSVGGVVATQAAETQRQYNETIRQAQGGGGATAATGPTAGVTAAASPSTNPAGAASTPKVVRAYFWVGTTPGPDADHNTFCQSNIMSITVNSKGGFDVYGLAREQLMPLLPVFIEKCSRLSKPEGSGQFFDDGGNGSPLQLNVLRRGDVQVHMP